MNASPESNIRYQRQIILPGVGTEGQDALRQARVLVIGMGGLGSPVSLYLAAAGVGTLGIADPDSVELSNLHRQILHTDGTTGQLKVDSARDRLLKQNPDLQVEPIPEGITPENALSVFGQYDLIVDGSDNFPTRYLVTDAACLAEKPVVYGSIHQFEGQVSLFDPANGTPCYRCLFPEPPQPGTVPNCAEAGVFGALCGIVGSWQASEAIKWILNIGDPLTGKMKVLDTLSGRDRLVALKKDPDCPLCGRNPVITDIKAENYAISCSPVDVPDADSLPMETDVSTVAGLLGDDPDLALLDVREDHERQIGTIAGSLHIPTGAVQFQWESLPRDKHLVVFCHHGMRSLFVTRFLNEKGFNRVQSMQGGIDAWSREIDSTIPRY